ncbi:MAG: hypothetical protein R2932_32995 [Caldilineaceae bacterium]
MTKLLLETMTIGNVPLLTIAPVTASHAPVVFFIPGYGGVKTDGLRLGYQLAQRGCFFVSIDPWLHGDRYAPRLDHAADPAYGGIYPPATGLDTGVLFFRVIQRCLTDVELLIDNFRTDERCDVTRCGVTGLSMGGCASFLIFANLPQVLAAVPMIGIPTFARRWTDLLDECRFSAPSWAAALARVQTETTQHTAFIHQIDPAEKLENAAPRALLIMNNDFDHDQPKHFAIDCYRSLLPAYATHPDQYATQNLPDRSHGDTGDGAGRGSVV